MPTSFTGTLNPNEIFSAIYNMIISQRVFADNIKGTYSELVDRARVDGTLYGDSKLYYATDCLKSVPWGNDSEATNLLALHRPPSPEVQVITLNQFRQVALTVDSYLSKQSWSTEGAFNEFNSVMKGWITDTKRIYDATLYNSFIGTVESNEGKQKTTITPISGQNDGLTMAEALANLLVELKDVSRDYNDYGFLRSYAEADLQVVWNAKHYNAIKKIDLPVVFHNDGLLSEFDQTVLPARYFGTVVGTAHQLFTIPAEGVQIYRTLVELDKDGVHLFPGEEIPEGMQVYQDETYMEDSTIAFKVMHKQSVPFMSAFEVGTSFFNPKSLTETSYLTWGYNDLDYLANYPMITVRFAE